MNIGIIVHSVTGNTLSVAKKLQENLTKNGYTVIVKEIKTEGKVNPGEKNVKFTELPQLAVMTFWFLVPIQRLSSLKRP